MLFPMSIQKERLSKVRDECSLIQKIYDEFSNGDIDGYVDNDLTQLCDNFYEVLEGLNTYLMNVLKKKEQSLLNDNNKL